MADVAADNNNGETEEERLVRLRQEQMEQMLMDQETQQQQQEEQEEAHLRGEGDVPLQPQELQPPGNNNNNNNNNNNEFHIPAAGVTAVGGGFRQKLSYTDCSFLAAFVTIFYALRTRGQWYLALVYLSSSKWAFCVLGNALVAMCVKLFSFTTNLFLQGGLRLHEAEGLQDFFRWNVTETCLALTMFRAELSVGTACEFLVLILVKCLHHVAIMRQDHLRMTDDAVQPASWNARVPTIPWHHMRVLSFLLFLQLLDLWALQYTTEILMSSGPSVSILFAFEAAILLVSAWSHLLLWHLHVLDGWLHFCHDLGSVWGRKWLHTWKEHKATLTFAVELQAQAVQFFFYLSFFGFVLTYYGVPINLFREVYISFSALKDRLVAFFKYRRLMAGMNRFANPSEEQLEEAGKVCIICRDEMTVQDCKQLPVCQHLFHKSCLREWLTQQQSCPTCRSDIAAMQAQETSRNAAARAASDRQQEDDGEGEADESNAQHSEEEEPLLNGERSLSFDPPTSTQPSTTDTKSTTQANGSTTGANGAAALNTNLEEDSKPAAKSTRFSKPEPQSTRTENNLPNISSPVAAAAARSGGDPDDFSWCGLPPTPPTKGKAVRFAESPHQTLQPAFPALYRVVKASGATVWHFESDEKESNHSLSSTQQEETGACFPIRTIPLSVVVLVDKEEAKHIPEQHGPRTTNFVRIPDGWVSEDEVLRVYTLE